MTVTVYYADTGALEDPVLFEELYGNQPGYRREKIDRYVFLKDKVLSLGAGALLQKVMKEHGIAEREPDYGPSGKPSIPGFSFNLSHSGSRVMCAVADSDVGCDVEQVSDIDLMIAKRFFFGSEYDAIMNSGDHVAQCDTFFRFWTLKESFMKATGLGFQLALDSFSVHLGDVISVEQEVDKREYHFREYPVGDGYKYSCCSTDPDVEKSLKRTSF